MNIEDKVVLRTIDYIDEVHNKEKELQSLHNSYCITNDFLCIREKSKDKLEKIAKDYNFVAQLVNIYPGNGYVSKLATDDYKILCICNKNNSYNIKKYLCEIYGLELDNIGEVINPIVNGINMCELFKANYVPF